MAVFKCKMCGGDLEITEGVSVAECEYCGTKQTVPQADNEKKITLFGRANRLRFANEFDKAAGVYESIVAEFPDEAEAYWGLVLCKYGIEYVDDPATGKKVPTCHRSSFESIMDDQNFEQAQENADPMARRVYREEAKTIEEIRKKIIEISGKEDPYDIFICYKETAEDGGRTVDSVLAQDIYTGLTEKGYRVFFSRISLEDKLGVEYEPYIFAALHSAKVMLAVGTDFEYYNAVWVKNEWSRFLQMIASGEKKVLIPCFKGLDAYDMPKEFAHLQAQDMGKVGAMQDLVRGIDKIFGRTAAPAAQTAANAAYAISAGPGIESMLKRGFLCLEDEDWEKAENLFNEVLNANPENAEGYLGLAMAEHQTATKEKFEAAYLGGSIPDNSKNITRVKQFGNNDLVQWVDKLEEKLRQRTAAIAEKRKQIVPAARVIANGGFYTVALKSDGTVIAVGENTTAVGDVKNWQDMVAVFAGAGHTVGLHPDGTVEAVGNNYDGQCCVNDWNNILTVACGGNYTIGLKSDGKVIAVGNNDCGQCNVRDWRNIAAVAACGVLHTKKQIDDNGEEEWVINGSFHTVGLNSDGTVVAVGDNGDGQCNVKHWRDMVAVTCGGYHTVGLKSNGTVEAVGYNRDGQCNVKNWQNIIAVAAGDFHTVGLRSDGTVVAVGNNDFGRCDVNDWYDIVAVKCGNNHTVGLKSDGTVVATGHNNDGQCDVSEWKLFGSIDTLEQELTETQNRNRQAAAAAANIWPERQKQAALAAGCISAEEKRIVGLKTNGTMVSTSYNLSSWNDIIAVASGEFHTVGVRSDGTVMAVGFISQGMNYISSCDEIHLKKWRDIVAVDCDTYLTVGLKSDGTLIIGGIDLTDNYDYNQNHQRDVSNWHNIVAVACGSRYMVRQTNGRMGRSAPHIVGLKSDGRVVASGSNFYGECDVEGWNNIVAIGCSSSNTVGVKSDGRVVAVGKNDCGQCNVTGWRNIVSVACGTSLLHSYTVGVKSDGTVVVAGQCPYDITEWKDVVAVCCSSFYMLGLKSDGTVMAAYRAGEDEKKLRAVSSWKLFNHIETLEQEQAEARDQIKIERETKHQGNIDALNSEKAKLQAELATLTDKKSATRRKQVELRLDAIEDELTHIMDGRDQLVIIKDLEGATRAAKKNYREASALFVENRIFIGKDIPQNKITKAVENYAVAVGSGEYPILLADSTILRTGKGGLLLTNKALYFSRGFLKPARILLSDIAELKSRKSCVIASLKNGKTEDIIDCIMLKADKVDDDMIGRAFKVILNETLNL